MMSYSVRCFIRKNFSKCSSFRIQRNFTQAVGSYYEVLGISRDASLKEIKTAYITLCKKLHPDSNPGDPDAQSNFVKLNEAYTHLSDPQKRVAYDEDIGIQRKPGDRNRIHKDMFKHGRKQDRSHHDMIFDWNEKRNSKRNMSEEELLDQHLRDLQERYDQWYKEYRRQQAEERQARTGDRQAPPPSEEETTFRETASEYKEAFHREGTKDLKEEEFSWPVLFGMLLHTSAQLGIFLVCMYGMYKVGEHTGVIDLKKKNSDEKLSIGMSL